MTSTNNQLIDSVRALLRETILPELQSDIAQARLRQIMATLRDVDWDEAPLAVLRENAVLQGLLQDQAPTAARDETAIPPFEAAVARNRELRRQLADRLASATASGWSPAHAAAARALADCARRRGQKRRAPSTD